MATRDTVARRSLITMVVVALSAPPDADSLAIARGAATLGNVMSAPFGGLSVTLPGTIQVENFDEGGHGVAYHDVSPGNSGGEYRMTDVDIEASEDTGGGYNIGWVSAGEWLNYTVNVSAPGHHTIAVRVASPAPGGIFHLEIDGRDVTGPIAVPDTGAWQAWETVEVRGIPLAAGVRVLRLAMDIEAASGAVGNFNWMRVIPEAGSTPFGGTPVTLPGTIQVENFDDGGQGVAYHDVAPGNSGGEYRLTDVDIETTDDAGGGYNVGWVSAGEWLNYTVRASASGLYTVAVRVASPALGGIFHLEIDSRDVTGPIAVPNTGAWQAWETIEVRGIPLAAGVQVLRLAMDVAATSGAVGNFNWMRVIPEAGSAPFSGIPVTLPGTIQAENFDDGGQGVAYHDVSPGNSGGEYRPTDVDIETTEDTGGGYNVGWVSAGEWLNYTVSVSAGGLYTIAVRVASPAADGVFHIESDGVDITGPVVVPNTSSWQAWATVQMSGVTLKAGTQVLRLVMDAEASTGAVGNFNWLQVASEPPPTPFAISVPAPGSTLRATAATFEWTGQADEFWLNIGSVPGAADVYASPSLGTATRHTVSPLPLHGGPLYVEVRRRVGAAISATTAQYTSPVRKGLAIVTDFGDRTLEDWTGPGMRSIDDVAGQLRMMEEHWAWLSRGLERFQWDIVRVRLPQFAVPGAFHSWVAFRQSAVDLARRQIDTRDYDVNEDGRIDTVWLIVSSGDVAIEWAVGGTALVGGANTFSDGQASTSVVAGATANFTHEVAHCLGIIDLYGAYGTLGSVSIMSYSWDLPPGDFTAYERLKLGWLTPQMITDTTFGIRLSLANTSFAAVKVPTRRAAEYFLIEYRRRPERGQYGSADVDYHGLLVYHVLEGSSMWQDPPIVKIEPADGQIAPSRPTDPYDFVYPENPFWRSPMVLYSYAAVPEEVFRVDNVVLEGDVATFDILMLPAEPSANLLSNASFEIGQAAPDDWLMGAVVGALDGFVWPSPVAVEGARSAEISSSFSNEKWWAQVVTTLAPGHTYSLCGWLKGERISGPGAPLGANVSLLNGWQQSYGRGGTFGWIQDCVTFSAEGNTAAAACRLGFSGSAVSGRLWCDAMSLDLVPPLRSAFPPTR